MTQLQIIVTIVFLIDFAVNIWADRTDNNLLMILTKPLLMPLLIVFYLISTASVNGLIIAALVAGFCGDVLLLFADQLKPENPGKQIFFGAGLLSFLCGHIFYTLTFLRDTDFLKIVPGWFYLLIIPYLIYGIVMYLKLKPGLHGLIQQIPIIVYMSAILFMSFSSLCRVWGVAGLFFWLPFIGSLLFIASDTALSIKTFIVDPSSDKGKRQADNLGAFIMITYVLAQVAMVLGYINPNTKNTSFK